MNEDLTQQHLNQRLQQQIDASMFAAFPGFLIARNGTTSLSGFTIRPGAVERTSNSAEMIVPPDMQKVIAETERRIMASLLALKEQVKAEEKAAPVLNAISAHHTAYRSDGRPHLFDPMKKA